jgi:hypothetical protein
MNLESTAGIESELSKKFDSTIEVTVYKTNRQVELSNCKEFLALPYGEFGCESTINNNVLWSYGVKCTALDWIQSAAASDKSLIGNDFAQPKFYYELPPILSAYPINNDTTLETKEAVNSCIQWSTFEKSLKIAGQSKYTFSVSGNGWSGSIKVLAKGDFNKDGYEDLLLERDGGPDGGTLYLQSLFIISKTEGDPCFKLIRQLN